MWLFMGNEIHAIKKDGAFLYRHYSTVSDMYNTPPLTEDEMFFFLLYDTAVDNLRSLAVSPIMAIHERMERARENGTSNKEDRRNLKRWEKRKQDYWGTRFSKERTKGAFLADISEYMAAPLSEHIALALRSAPGADGRDFYGETTPQAKENSNKIKGLLSLLQG